MSPSTKSRETEPIAAISGRAEALTSLQKEMLEMYAQAGRDWTDRELLTEFCPKLHLFPHVTSTKSVPEAMQAYHDVLSQRMQMAAKDGQKAAADAQKVAQKIMRLGK